MNKKLENFYDSNLFEQLGCTFQAYGANFDPEVLLNRSIIPIDRIIFNGIPGIPDNVRKKISDQGRSDLLAAFDTTFLLVKISDKQDISSQLVEAISFLGMYQDDLRNIRSLPEIEGLLIRFNSDQKKLSIKLPSEFRELASEIGIDSIII